MEKKFINPNELYDAVAKAKKTARENIIEILKGMENQSCNLIIDDNGNMPGDEDYDEYSVWDNHIWGMGYGKYNNEEIFLTRAFLNNKGELEVEIEGSESGETGFRNGFDYDIIDLYDRLYRLITK